MVGEMNKKNIIKIYLNRSVYYIKNYFKIKRLYDGNYKDIDEFLINKFLSHLAKLKYYTKKDYYQRYFKDVKIKNSIVKYKKYKIKIPHHYFDFTAGLILLPEVFIYKFGIKKLDNILKLKILNYIKEGSAIDGGAFIGDSSVCLIEYVERVYAFEPDKRYYQYLIDNIKLNDLTGKVIPIDYGLGYKRDKINFFGTIFNLIDIDNFIKKNKIKDLRLIKLDIEGYEIEALKGAKNTIKKYKPILIVAAYHKDYDILEIPKYINSIYPNYKFIFFNLRKNHPLFERYIFMYPNMLKNG